MNDVKLRIGLPCKGAGLTDTIFLEVTLGELVKAGGMIKENPEKYKGEEATLMALRDLWAGREDQSATAPSDTSQKVPE